MEQSWNVSEVLNNSEEQRLISSCGHYTLTKTQSVRQSLIFLTLTVVSGNNIYITINLH